MITPQRAPTSPIEERNLLDVLWQTYTELAQAQAALYSEVKAMFETLGITGGARKYTDEYAPRLQTLTMLTDYYWERWRTLAATSDQITPSLLAQLGNVASPKIDY